MNAVEVGPGVRISGYLLSEEIGSGGFSRVFRAEPEGGGPSVAVKVPLRPELAAALRGERDALGKLEGPRFVGLIAEHLDGDPPHLVLELCPGGDLRALLERSPNRRIDDHTRVDSLFRGILEGVADAHADGVVHGDLKPENILLDENGTPRIADFGLARTAREELGQDVSLAVSLATGEGKFRGTLDYLAPELRRGGKATTQSDVFALGIMLYEMLTGERPFGVFTLPSEAVGAPAVFDRVIKKALGGDSSARYPDAEAMLSDLEAGHRPPDRSPPPPTLAESVLAGAILGIVAGVVCAVALREWWSIFGGVFAGGALGGWFGALAHAMRLAWSRAVRAVAPWRRQPPSS